MSDVFKEWDGDIHNVSPDELNATARFYVVVDAESDGVTLKTPSVTLPGLDKVTWERLRIHNEVEAMDWPDTFEN